METYLSDKELFDNFIIIVYSPNPLKDNITLLIDDEKRIIKRDMFLSLLRQTLNESIPAIKEEISKIEMSIYEFGGWFYYDRETNKWGELIEQPDTSRIQLSKVRNDVIQHSSEIQNGIGLRNKMQDIMAWKLGPEKRRWSQPTYQYFGRN